MNPEEYLFIKDPIAFSMNQLSNMFAESIEYKNLDGWKSILRIV